MTSQITSRPEPSDPGVTANGVVGRALPPARAAAAGVLAAAFARGWDLKGLPREQRQRRLGP